ncbi:MAG: aminoacyl-tRNA hydrolase [Bacteroidota bacterium]|nr:aminoacyl-tRNA hydrolase [Bacteroidota bacterium]MDX5426493.1 aminoacyl-tRNA hydrolase [Bacteroidota bacterium]MDX5504520.1 aminoacyl-tRNA hydrolase [Bacteroidota bacterium]
MKKYLIAGLGNPGTEYSNTRHNIGFEVLDALAGASNIFFKPERYADRAEMTVKGRKLVLIKPNTYMNLSGKAIRYWLEQEKIDINHLLVVVDEIALPLGALRIKLKGSDGGHNGLKNIQDILQTTNYPRLRFGIGNEYPKGGQVDFVLGEWTEEEKNALKDRIKLATEAIVSFALAGPQLTMTQFNKK